MMRYVLVLQFPAYDIQDYDRLIQMEDALIKDLRGLAEVDGHDSGSGEMNIFVFTNEPEATFEKAKIIVKAAGLLSTLSAAYRLIEEDKYTRLWPIGSIQPFGVA